MNGHIGDMPKHESDYRWTANIFFLVKHHNIATLAKKKAIFGIVRGVFILIYDTLRHYIKKHIGTISVKPHPQILAEAPSIGSLLSQIYFWW